MPIFDLKDSFDTAIAIGDQELPIHVRRMSRADLDAFEKQWKTLMEPPRGGASPPEPSSAADVKAAYLLAEAERLQAWDESVATERLVFFETTIREYLTVDEGLLVNRGKAVTDGAGLIEMFYARKDILSRLVAAVFVENHLGGVIRKNSNSPRASEAGSGQSIPVRGGAEQGSTVGSAASSGTAAIADATASSDRATDDGEPSGASEPEAVH